MKRTHSESCQENDDDLPLKLQSDEKPNSDVVESTNVEEIIGLCDDATVQSFASDDKPLPQTHSIIGKITYLLRIFSFNICLNQMNNNLFSINCTNIIRRTFL